MTRYIKSNEEKLLREAALYDRAKTILREMIEECASDMISVGIPIQQDKIVDFGLADTKKRHAVCWFDERSDGYIIGVHKKIVRHLDDSVVLANLKNSVYHELLHTIPGATSHNEVFLKWAIACDEQLGTETRVFKEAPIYYHKKNAKAFTYVCPHCGFTYVSAEVVEAPIAFACPICETVMSKA